MLATKRSIPSDVENRQTHFNAVTRPEPAKADARTVEKPAHNLSCVTTSPTVPAQQLDKPCVFEDIEFVAVLSLN